MATRRKFIGNVIAGGVGGIVTSGFGSFPEMGNSREIKGKISLYEARKLHDECLIFDGHNDTTVERVARGENISGMLKLNKAYQSDFPRMKEIGYDAGAFIVGNGIFANVWTTMEQTLAMISSNPDKFILVHSSKDVLRAKETGKVGILMAIEGIAKWINGETDILRMLYRNGIRWVSITHGEGGPSPKEVSVGPLYKKKRLETTYLQGTRTPVKAYCTPEERKAELKNTKGLTGFGKEVLKVNNELGIVTDLAHTNDKAFFDVLELTDKPVAVSHAATFSVTNNYRNVTDDQIRAIAANGGVIGVFLYKLIGYNPENVTLDTYIKHIAHIADLVGVDYVGIGSDLDGGELLYTDMSQLVKITQGMMEYGFSNNEIKKIWGYNFLRVLEQNIDTRT